MCLFPSSLFLFSFEKRHPQGTPTKEGRQKNKKCVCVWLQIKCQIQRSLLCVCEPFLLQQYYSETTKQNLLLLNNIHTRDDDEDDIVVDVVVVARGPPRPPRGGGGGRKVVSSSSSAEQPRGRERDGCSPNVARCRVHLRSMRRRKQSSSCHAGGDAFEERRNASRARDDDVEEKDGRFRVQSFWVVLRAVLPFGWTRVLLFLFSE